MATDNKLLVGQWCGEWWVVNLLLTSVAGPFETREAALAARALMEGAG